MMYSFKVNQHWSQRKIKAPINNRKRHGWDKFHCMPQSKPLNWWKIFLLLFLDRLTLDRLRRGAVTSPRDLIYATNMAAAVTRRPISNGIIDIRPYNMITKVIFSPMRCLILNLVWWKWGNWDSVICASWYKQNYFDTFSKKAKYLM